MAIFNLSKKNKKEKNSAAVKRIVGASLLGIASVLFLFSATKLWPWLQDLLLGVFGVFIYPLCIVLMVLSIALLNNKKYVMSKRYAVFMILSIIFLLAIIQLIIVGNKFDAEGNQYSFWQYLTFNYKTPSNSYTAGGFLIGLLTTCLLFPLNLAGTYVILCVAFALCVAFFVEAIISFKKSAAINSPVKIQVSEQKKAPKEPRENAMKSKEEVSIVMNGEIAENLAKEEEVYPAFQANETKPKGGIPEGKTAREYLLEPPKVDLEKFRQMEEKLKKQQSYSAENKSQIDRNFAELKGQESIMPTQHLYEEQYDFSQAQHIKRGGIPEYKQDNLLEQVDNIVSSTIKQEISAMNNDENDDFLIKEPEKPKDDDIDGFISSFDEEEKKEDNSDYISFDSVEEKPKIDTSFTTRRDGYLRDNTDFSRNKSEQTNLARDRQLENLSALTERRGDAFSRDRNNINLTRRQIPAQELEKQERFKPYKYTPPSIDLITTQSDDLSVLNEETPQKRVALENALETFGIPAKVQGVVVGPTVTRYELTMPEGISVKRILSLDYDIALTLSAKGQIRIEAPVPGRSVVGIEVPNDKIAKVSIKDVLMSKEFTMSPSPLAFALGKDINGTVKVCNLAKMPHLLVAGTTGSGKSVCLNAIIVSMLYKASPDDVKFIMIDPKQVELSMYEGLPHMVIPKVITDATKAVNALQWAVDEMERRFNLIRDASVRNIDEYNKTEDVQNGKKKKIPYLVIIFDEFADFMLVAKNEIEDKIMRLAQKARAAGVHLILATQRPSTDVVTGTIKANFPSRIAFKVAGRVDSEVIMGSPGAEKLLGYGDMLYKPSDSSPARIQGCFIDTPETKDVVNFIIQNNEETYDEDAYNAIFNPGKSTSGGGDKDDIEPLLPQALKLCIDAGVASTTMLQRKLSVGYPKAARIIDQMEERGYISSAEGAKQRTVYTTIEEFYELFGDQFE